MKSLTVTQAQDEVDRSLNLLREWLVVVAKERVEESLKGIKFTYDLIPPSARDAIGWLLMTGRYDEARRFVDVVENYVAAQCNLSIAQCRDLPTDLELMPNPDEPDYLR